MAVSYTHRGDRFIFDNYLSRGTTDFLYIETAGYTRPRPSYSVKRDYSTETDLLFVLEYVLDGEGYIVYDGVKHKVSKGDFYMMNDSRPHTYYADSENPFSKIWINVRGSFMEKTVEALQLPPLVIEHMDAEESILAIHRMLEGKNAYEVRGMEEELLVELLRLLYHVKEQIRNRTEQDNTFLKIKNYINIHITDNLTVEKICEEFFISKSTLYRMFVKETEMSPAEYIKRAKIRIACRILTRTTIEMSEIMQQLGYYDYSHFSRVFRSVMDTTPVAYRKEHMKRKKDRKNSVPKEN